MRANRNRDWQKCACVRTISLPSLCLLLLFVSPIVVIPIAAPAERLNLHKEPQPYALQKLKSYELVFLGTRHRKKAVLKFVAGLIPRLHETKTAHLGLEIPSDQQGKIDRFLQTGRGLNDIKLHPQLDCPEYRSLFTTVRSLDQSKRPAVVAVDLPKSMYRGEFNRDEWMARSIAKIFHREPNAKVLVMVGNLHVLKKMEWEDTVPNAHGFIRSYLNRLVPHRHIFSIGQLIDESPNECDFTNAFSHLEGAVAMDCNGGFAGWRIGFMAPVAAKPIEVCEQLDGIIVY